MKTSAMKIVASATLVLATAPAFAQGKPATAKSGQCPDEMAFLANTKKANITSDERHKVRIKAFESLDANKDGMVSRDEYVSCLTATKAFKPVKNGAGAKPAGK